MGGRSAFLHHRAAARAAAGHVTAAATFACVAGHRVTRRWKRSCCVGRRHRHGGNPAARLSLLFHRHAVAHRIAAAPFHRGLLLHRRHAAAARPGKSSQHNGACEMANTGHDQTPAKVGSTIMEANSPLVKPCAAASPTAGAHRSQTCWIARDCRARRSAHLALAAARFSKDTDRKAGRGGAPAPGLLKAVELKVAEVLRLRAFNAFQHTAIAGQPPRGREIRSCDRSLPARCRQSR
jgi:hypothetical protein